MNLHLTIATLIATRSDKELQQVQADSGLNNQQWCDLYVTLLTAPVDCKVMTLDGREVDATVLPFKARNFNSFGQSVAFLCEDMRCGFDEVDYVTVQTPSRTVTFH
jgi:hypothetical protein